MGAPGLDFETWESNEPNRALFLPKPNKAREISRAVAGDPLGLDKLRLNEICDLLILRYAETAEMASLADR
jgi:hypothetical protein